MGSLMAGWDSPRTSKKVFGRNLSLTKDEIQQYWKNRNAIADDKCSTSSCSTEPSPKRAVQKSSTFSTSEDEFNHGMNKERAKFIPVMPQKELLKSKTFSGREAVVEVQTSSLAPGSAPSDWWRKTDWAFLNQAPVIESSLEGVGSASRSKSSTFVSQHNVASRNIEVDRVF